MEVVTVDRKVRLHFPVETIEDGIFIGIGTGHFLYHVSKDTEAAPWGEDVPDL